MSYRWKWLYYAVFLMWCKINGVPFNSTLCTFNHGNFLVKVIQNTTGWSFDYLLYTYTSITKPLGTCFISGICPDKYLPAQWTVSGHRDKYQTSGKRIKRATQQSWYFLRITWFWFSLDVGAGASSSAGLRYWRHLLKSLPGELKWQSSRDLK